MKAIILHNPFKGHHATLWDLLTSFFHPHDFNSENSRGFRNDELSPADTLSELKFFEGENELEEYIQSFRS